MKKRWIAGVLAAAMGLLSAAEAGAMSLDGQPEAVAVEAFTSEPEAFSEAAPEEWPLEEPVIGEPEEIPLGEASPEETPDPSQWQTSVEDVAEEISGQPGEGPAGDLTSEAVFSSGVDPQIETEAAPNTWQWDPAKGAFTYYDGQGSPVPVSALAAGNPLGYFEINGSCYCLDGQGVPRTGEITLISGGAAADYYFMETPNASGIPGEMATGWRVAGSGEEERWLYYDTGRKNPADRGKLFTHGVIATKLDTARKGEELYLLDRDGTLLRNAMKKAENGRIYLTDDEGQVYKNRLVTYEDSQYYVGKNGARVTWKKQWHRCSGADNRLYYFGKTPGKVVKKTGWQKVMVNGRFYGWFYFAKNGKHYKDKMLKSGLYFKENGRLASGVTQIDGRRYFFAVSTASSRAGKMVKNQLIQQGSNWYYAGEDGRLKKSGWKTISGIDYYFKDYKAVRNTFVKKGSVQGYLDNTGRFTTGWVIENDGKNRVRYVDAAKGSFVKNTSRVINGLTYFFDKDGYRINDVTDRVAGPYSLVADRVNGVMTVYNSNRTIPVRSIRISVGLPNTPTPVGTFRLTPSARWQPLMGNSWGQYGTHVTGNVLVHSVPGGSPDPYQLPAVFYNLLGQPASHGCIRVCVADAKWVYERCGGAAITILDGAYREEEVFKGPLGKPPLVPLVAPYNYDPTDPALKENQ